MLIGIVTPAAAGSRMGNRVTALRWAAILRDLGHEVEVVEAWRQQDFELLIALHAAKSHASAEAFRLAHPGRALIVALTGTDLYRDWQGEDSTVQRSLEMADAIVTLQPRALARLPEVLAARGVAIFQASEAPQETLPPRDDAFDVAVIGHLRPVKDPFLTAVASRRMPPTSRLHVFHVGGALTPDMEAAARSEMRTNPRYTWLGSLSLQDTLRELSRCRLLVLTSRMEGGANVISEALTCNVPVLATRIEGTVGMLGDDYPGLFEVGDVRALAALLERAESDPAFLEELQTRCRTLREQFEPAREREAWRDLLARWVPQRTAGPPPPLPE